MIRTEVGSRDIQRADARTRTHEHIAHTKFHLLRWLCDITCGQADERAMKPFNCRVYSTPTKKQIPSLPKYEIEPDTVQFYELHTYSIINIRMGTRCKAFAYKLLHFAKLFSIYNMEDKIFSIPSIQTVKTWPKSWPLTGNISLTRSDAVACLAIVSDTRQITCHIYPVSGSLLYSAGIRPERWTENPTTLRKVRSEENFVLYCIKQ